MRSVRDVVLSALILSVLVAMSPFAFADKRNNESDAGAAERMGFVEWIVLKDTDLRIKARLDTGAKTSSLHAEKVEPFEKDGEEWVRFQIPLDGHLDPESKENEGIVLELERPVERTVLIKRKGAPSQRRYVVNMDFCIAGDVHETEFSLTDRGSFTYPALLGRRFMKDDNVLVDSSDSFLADQECEYDTLDTIAENASNIAE